MIIDNSYGLSFEFGGRNWALRLQYGMPEKELIHRATDWLKIELERVGYKYL